MASSSSSSPSISFLPSSSSSGGQYLSNSSSTFCVRPMAATLGTRPVYSPAKPSLFRMMPMYLVREIQEIVIFLRKTIS